MVIIQTALWRLGKLKMILIKIQFLIVWNYNLKKSGIETEFTKNIDLDWAVKDVSRL